jgi:hypothetical protein
LTITLADGASASISSSDGNVSFNSNGQSLLVTKAAGTSQATLNVYGQSLNMDAGSSQAQVDGDLFFICAFAVLALQLSKTFM